MKNSDERVKKIRRGEGMKKITQISVIQRKEIKVYALCENGDLRVGKYKFISTEDYKKGLLTLVWTNLLKQEVTNEKL